MTEKIVSPRMREHMLQQMDRDEDAGLPARPPQPQRPAVMPKPPMAAMPRRSRVFIDGQLVSEAPGEWSTPRKPALPSSGPQALTDAEEREARKRSKRQERELVEMRSAARQAREEEQRAIEELRYRPMSAEVKSHFLRQLTRPDAE
jgi:hypothetical protein